MLRRVSFFIGGHNGSNTDSSRGIGFDPDNNVFMARGLVKQNWENRDLKESVEYWKGEAEMSRRSVEQAARNLEGLYKKIDGIIEILPKRRK